MTYYINVYETSNQPFHVSPCWPIRKQAKYDYKMRVKDHKYLHTIHVDGGHLRKFNFHTGVEYYKDYEIHADYVGYGYAHKDYDGPDGVEQCGTAETVEKCKEAIDELYLEGEA